MRVIPALSLPSPAEVVPGAPDGDRLLTEGQPVPSRAGAEGGGCAVPSPGLSESNARYPGHYHHQAPPPSCAGLGAGGLWWKLAKELPEATVIWNKGWERIPFIVFPAESRSCGTAGMH